MPKKKFNKKDGLRFTLMHRSQQDPLYHDEENGSRYILHPADAKTAAAMEDGLELGEGVGASYVSSEAAAKSKRAIVEKRKKTVGPIIEYREVDENGLPIDGYDYSKHLSEMGGGVFIASDGTKLDKAPTLGEKVDAEEEFMQMLPDTVFASKEEHPRLLEAITLNADDMDFDMKVQLGLAEGEEEEEEDVASDATGMWGDLQDDFMEQIISSGVVEKRDDDVDDDDGDRRGPKLVKGVMRDDFDFDAHMARLMQEAEEEEEEDDDDDDFDLDGLEQGPRRAMRDVDKHFEAVLAAEYEDDDDYDGEEDEQDIGAEEILEHIEQDDGFEDQLDDELGEGEEVEEEEEEELVIDGNMPTSLADLNALMKGSVSDGTTASKRKANDLETRSTMTRKSKRGGVAPLLTQDDPVFLSAVQEFLQEKSADASLGLVANPPSAKETLAFVQQPIAPAGQDEKHSNDAEVVDAVPEDDENERPSLEEFMKLWGTYSVTEKPHFDCETIVSTRSTTDNLPSEIVIENTKKKKKKEAAKMATQVIVEEEEEGDDVASNTDTIEDVSRDIAKMALSGVATRRKEETAEERKARKALVKELRRDRRNEKRQTKDAFKRERSQFLNMVNAPGAPKIGVSEFKLS